MFWTRKKNGYKLNHNVKDTIYNPRVLLLRKEINSNEEDNNNEIDNCIKDFDIYLSKFICH